MKTDFKKQGFSLAELLVSMLATAVLVLIVSLVLLMPVRSSRTNNEYARLRRDMALAVQMMARDIRESSGSQVTASENLLILLPGPVFPGAAAIKYERSTADGVLRHYVDGVEKGSVITEGLRRFDPVSLTNAAGVVTGIMLDLEIEGRGGDITAAHQTFIHVRN